MSKRNNGHAGSANVKPAERSAGRPTEPRHGLFRRFAEVSAAAMGSKPAFAIAVLLIVAWAITGPMFHFSDTWQLVINTATTIVTFLMVFLIQNTQNRDARAIHLKLDELLRALKGARTRLVDLENVTDGELDRLQEEFQLLHEREKVKAERREQHKGDELREKPQEQDTEVG